MSFDPDQIPPAAAEAAPARPKTLADKITSLQDFLDVEVPRIGKPRQFHLSLREKFSGLPISVPFFTTNTDSTTGISSQHTSDPPQRMWWAVREHFRIEFGAYPEGTTVLDWLLASRSRFGFPPAHYVHVSKDDPSLIAFTPDEASGLADRQLRMTLGRYLKKYLLLTDEQIKRLEEQHRADMSNEFELLTGMDIVKAYLSTKDTGASSCMSYSADRYSTDGVHPTEVYDAPGFAMAVLRTDGGRIKARCMVWVNPADPNDKRAVRVYGDGVLSRRLRRAGFEFKPLYGAVLKAIEVGRHQVVLPYLDGVEGRQSDGTTNVVRRPDGLHMLSPDDRESLVDLATECGFEHVWSSGKHTDGVARLSLIPWDFHSYVCALSGETLDRRAEPACEFVRGPGEPLQQASANRAAAAVERGELCTVTVARAGRRRPVFAPASVPTADVGDLSVLVDDESMCAFNMQKLSPRYYPEDTGWHRMSVVVTVLDTADAPHNILGDDAVWVVRRTELHGNQRYMAHKSEAVGMQRVSDYDSHKLYVAADVPVRLTDTKRKVVMGVHDVCELQDGNVTFLRNTVVAQPLGYNVRVRRGEALTIGDYTTAALPADAPHFKYIVEGEHRRGLEELVARRAARAKLGLAQADTQWVVSSYQWDPANLPKLLALGENATADTVIAAHPATPRSTAAFVAAQAHNLCVLNRMVADELAALDAAAGARNEAQGYTPPTWDQLHEGTRVTVMREYDPLTDPEFSAGWVDDMSRWVGTDAEVYIDADPGSEQVHLRAPNQDEHYTFPLCVLKLADAAPAQDPVFNAPPDSVDAA